MSSPHGLFVDDFNKIVLANYKHTSKMLKYAMQKLLSKGQKTSTERHIVHQHRLMGKEIGHNPCSKLLNNRQLEMG